MRSFSEVPLDTAEVKDGELKLARLLVEESSSDVFRPEAYEDEVRKRVQEALDRKVQGGQFAVTAAPKKGGEIVDLMYTSCGWFFDDPAGLETRQVLRYAARAVELAEEHLGGSIEPLFLKLLERVRSGLGERPDGSELYRTLRAPLPPSAAALPS